MPQVPKDWQDWPSTATRRDAAAMKALESRVANYAGQDGRIGQGAAGYEDFRVKQRVAGANMSVDVGLASVLNALYVPADGAGGSQRYEYSGTQLNVLIGAADGGNPRIDRVVAEAPTDADDLAPLITVLQGTPTGGATLDNLNGAQAVASGRIQLADVLVAAGVTSILTAAIRERRRQPITNTAPIFTGRDEVIFQPNPGYPLTTLGIAAGSHDNLQAAALMFLPRRIASATRIRWRYRQGATAATSNYNIGIADLSGRVLASGGATAFAGATTVSTEAALTIGATTFDAGWYWVVMGIAAMTGSSTVIYHGADVSVNSSQGPGVATRNIGLRAAAGGTTLPTTLLGLTDVASLTGDTAAPRIPLVGLSVG